MIEFGVMTLEGDGYSSIACFVGTNRGHVATFKILPSGPSYTAKLAGVAKCGGSKVVSMDPVNVDNGQPAGATAGAVGGLREGRQVNGVLVVGEFLCFHPYLFTSYVTPHCMFITHTPSHTNRNPRLQTSHSQRRLQVLR